MKDTYIDIINIRRMAFEHIAKIAYENRPITDIATEVYEIIPGEEARYRENIFRERAVMGERLRMGIGLDARTADKTDAVTEGLDKMDVNRRIYNPPLVSVMKIACEACPENKVTVTDQCKACIGHPCVNVCPKNAVTYTSNGAIIDQEKCIKCGKCVEACPYHAINHQKRPCAAICGVKAIHSDELGRAQINSDKCVACGKCISACPFGAISDKSEIYQLIKSIQSENHTYAIIAPSFAGQFGPNVSAEQIREAIKQLGFDEVIEVGLGADLTTMNEAHEYLEEVPSGKIPFMGTSCCFSWKMMVRKQFPEINDYISESSTPMIYTGLQLKKKDPNSKITFIGPCISKKLEALEPDVAEVIDFVITFEELLGMFLAKGIEPSEIEVEDQMMDASETGRTYAVSGGVAQAVVKRAQEIRPGIKVDVENAEGLANCVKLAQLAKLGKMDGKLIEGMACEGGCVGGPGTVVARNKTGKAVKAFAKESVFKSPADNTNIPDKDKPDDEKLKVSE
ncbi:MAG: 4Fe-4S dicluster domain-containing protein [Anaerococcus sp.]|uniref:4Fe-4S dicluster domain-containing protein n=1 Tax=Anaerococcus sp. TaxID=1872515 RepID=UPI0028FFC793|nr:4Fe-4S dicluster domain-containing protein [Anaerococcus sp.]MDU1829422.1 4Fe-4S dicluster domain-containing protein [Anaerococcus sp.]MDU1863750.1 4Fe-4S dicluster domain-containing protein [Anaerococcus sp.]MDU2353797.1 4Fe-4S dicluster domain-containing protein [Anaerococcus sp.]